MMLERRTLLAGALLAPGLAARNAGAADDPRPVLRVAVQALSASLAPLEAINNVGLRIIDNVFDTLLRRDFQSEAATGTSKLDPHLATSLVQRDPLTWVATLRQDVRLHDGRAMTAEDVVATFAPDRMWGPKSPFYEGRISFGHLTEVVAEGPYTVVFRTKAPDVVMPHRLAAYAGWIGSAAYLADPGLAGMRARPVGTGPFRVSAFVRDQSAVLDAVDAYFGGRPNVRQIRFTVVPESAARLAGLQAGDFDIATNLLPDQMPTVAHDARVEVVSAPMDLAHLLFYDTRQPALRDPRVRRALNHAVDYDLMGRTLWGPAFKRMAALQVPSFGDFYEADRPGFVYDPERSRALLKAAGWRGETLVIRIINGYYLNMLQAVQIIQNYWEAVGVPSRLEVRENADTLNAPGADVRPTSVSFRFPDPLGGGLTVHLSRDYSIQTGGFWTPVRFNDISDAFRAAIEPAERKRLWHALMDEFEAEAPAMILYPVREVFGKRRDLRFTQYPLYYLDARVENLGFT